MHISVTYEDSDVAKVLGTIIDHPNKDEFVKLLTPMICSSSNAATYLFKAMIGNKLPDVHSVGALCKLPVSCLSSDAKKDNIRQKFADEDDMVVVKVVEFRGFHDWSDYVVEAMNVFDDGTTKPFNSYVKAPDLIPIDEF